MRTPSNRMHRPPAPDRGTAPRGVVLALTMVFLACLGGLLWHAPLATTAVIAAILSIMFAAEVLHRRRDRRIASSRPGESLCSFARAFDCRRTDTWIIRAVYERFRPCAGFPLRASDRLHDELCLDPDDIDDMAEEIGRLIARPLENSEQNPVFGKVETLADMVAFFSHQERAA